MIKELDNYYEKIVRGEIDYRNVPDMEEFLKSIELEDNYDKLDSLEKAHIINTYVARLKLHPKYFCKEFPYEDDQELEDKYTYYMGRAIDDWIPDIYEPKFNPPKFDVSAILAANKIGMI